MSFPVVESQANQRREGPRARYQNPPPGLPAVTEGGTLGGPRALDRFGEREPTEPWSWYGPARTVTGP